MIHQFVDKRLLDFTLWIERMRSKRDAAKREPRVRGIEEKGFDGDRTDTLGMDEILPHRVSIVGPK